MARRSLQRPLTPEQLRPLEPEVTLLQFSQGLTDEEYAAVAELLADRPDVTLRAFGGYGRTLPDLEWLRFFPRLRRVSIDALWGVLRSVDGLRHLPDDLEELGFGNLKTPLDLRGLDRFRDLRSLGIEGPVRHPEAIAAFTRLEDLMLRSVTLPDLSPLLPMSRLPRLELKLGGTRDLRLLPRVGELVYLEVWLVRGLTDVGPVADIPTLEHLSLQALKGVTRLPSFAQSTALRRVDLDTMKGLVDLAPLAEAPNLEILNLVAFNHAQPAILEPFIGHPSLRAGIWGFGSDRRNFAAQDLLPLPPEPWRYGAVRRGEPAGPAPVPWNQPDWTGFRTARP